MKTIKETLRPRLCHCSVCGVTLKVKPKDLRNSFRNENYYVLKCKVCGCNSVRWYLYD